MPALCLYPEKLLERPKTFLHPISHSFEPTFELEPASKPFIVREAFRSIKSHARSNTSECSQRGIPRIDLVCNEHATMIDVISLSSTSKHINMFLAVQYSSHSFAHRSPHVTGGSQLMFYEVRMSLTRNVLYANPELSKHNHTSVELLRPAGGVLYDYASGTTGRLQQH